MARRRLLLVLLIAAACSGPPPPPSASAPVPAAAAAAPTRFAAVDLYGSERFTAEALLAPVAARFADFERAWFVDPASALPVKQQLERDLAEQADLAAVSFSIIEYYRPGRPSYLTIDVVERGDAARRLTFASPAADAADLPDPEGLLARYAEYEAKGFALLRDGATLVDPVADRETFHAVFGFAHPELAPYRAPLLDGARRHVDELAELLRRDRDPRRRGLAAFLLAFTTDGARVVRELAPACRDASPFVRNNALRVFAEMARHHPEVELPLAPILAALDGPETTDRNKAAAILEPLSRRSELQATIRRSAARTLVAMVALQQPNNRDFAGAILRIVSGASYATEDLAAWRAWLAAQPP